MRRRVLLTQKRPWPSESHLLAAWVVTVARSVGAECLPIYLLGEEGEKYCEITVSLEERFLDFLSSVSHLQISENEREGRAFVRGLRGPTSLVTPKFTLGFGDVGDLALVASVEGLAIRYRTALFEQDAMVQLVSRFECLLEGTMRDPRQILGDFPLMNHLERQKIVEEWNATDSPWPRDRCMHEFFEARVVQHPERAALVCGEETVSYQRLHQDVIRLCEVLIDSGVAPDTPVALFLEPGVSTVVAIYGTLRAGGFYIPLDSAWPPERIRDVLEDASPVVILTETHLQRSLSAFGSRVLCLDDLPEPSKTRSFERPVPSSAVYCLYTSGTTGTPKGVVVEHQGLVKRIQWLQDQCALGGEDRVLQKTPCGFGISEWEFFWALSFGATLVIADPGGSKDPHYLEELMRKERVTVGFFVPSMLAVLLDLLEVNGRALALPLRWMFTCGEALSPDVCMRFFACFQARLMNLYGPTEADMTWWECPALGEGERPVKVPIGKAIANSKVYLLDARREPVPIGVPGELYLGGQATARGYLNRPELTEARFLANPFDEGRLYRTGDLAQWLPDGNLEFLGRADSQIKLRGNRVELGEIEAILLQGAGVQQAVVLLRGDRPETMQLVACLTPGNLESESIQRHCQNHLPGYMVPSTFYAMDCFPLTDRQKLDRRRLRMILDDQDAVATEVEVVLSDSERRLASLWSQVGVCAPWSSESDFFELGGSSLGLMKLAAAIQGEYDCIIPLQQLMTSSQLGSMARLVEGDHGRDTACHSLTEIKAGDIGKRPLFLVHGIGGGMLWGYKNLSEFLDEDQPVFAFSSRGHAGLPEHRTPRAMAEAYVHDMRSRQPSGPYAIGGYCFGGNVAYEMARVLEGMGETVDLLLLIDAYPFYEAGCQKALQLRSVGECVRFLTNFYHKLVGLGTLTKEDRQNHLRRMRRWLRLKFSRTPDDAHDAVKTLTDTAAYSKRQAALWEAHWQMYDDHVDGSYSGAAVLLRTRAQPVFSCHTQVLGWSRVIQGDLETITIPGHHDALFVDPNVRFVADNVTARLRVRSRRTYTTGVRVQAMPTADQFW